MWKGGLVPRLPAWGQPAARRLGFHLERGMRVGLYGGSFDPAHAGHAHVAETALRRLALDRVIWLVSPQNPLKAAGAPETLRGRMAGARARARGPAMIVSDAETRQGARPGSRTGARFTIDTVRWFKARFPGVHFVWIMGADNLAHFHGWRGWAPLMREVPVAVVSRPAIAVRSRFAPAARRFARGHLAGHLAAGVVRAKPPAWTYVVAPFQAVSSTALRNCADPEAGA